MQEQSMINKGEAATIHEELAESGTIICNLHPFSNNHNQNPGGICAFCLQEKLGDLVSSSFPITVFPSSSSFRSDFVHHKNGAKPKTNINGPKFSSSSSSLTLSSRRARIFPFLLTHKKKKQREILESSIMNDKDNDILCFSDLNRNINLRRSKSTVSSRRNGFMGNEHLPARKGIWSFLHLTKSDKILSPEKEQCGACKVSRSRSVGCGSRSFSGDIFERISTGLGDCTLRRVESQREAKPKASIAGAGVHGENHRNRMKCGGMFRGFSMTTSPEENNGKSAVEHVMNPVGFNRSKKWGWVFASPIRAFTSSSKNGVKNNAIRTPDLNAIPSLLNV